MSVSSEEIRDLQSAFDMETVEYRTCELALRALRAESSGPDRLPADVVPFIRHVTLELQSNRSRTPEQMDTLFQQAYRFYHKYQVDYNVDKEEVHGIARPDATPERQG